MHPVLALGLLASDLRSLCWLACHLPALSLLVCRLPLLNHTSFQWTSWGVTPVFSGSFIGTHLAFFRQYPHAATRRSCGPHGSRCHWLAQLPSARKSLSWPKTQTLYSPAPGPDLPNLQSAVTPRQTIQILSRLSLPMLLLQKDT